MNCDNCGEDSSVIDSRPSKLFNGSVRRRRVCKGCKRRWMTLELNEDAARYLYDNKKWMKKADLPL